MANIAKLNPHYGSGRYRRAILLRNTGSAVVAALEDCNHGFTLTLRHDGHQITGVSGEARRVPLNTCNDAPQALAALVGFPLDGGSADWRRQADPSHQCTHLFDLATLALAQARRASPQRRYDVVVEDARDGLQTMSVVRDGEIVLRWIAGEDTLLTDPLVLAGRPIMRGFHAWASEHFRGDTLEAAVVLQRGYFVANARRFDMDAGAGEPAAEDGMPGGVCYSYSEPAIHQAFRVGNSVRDFSDCPEQLLTFS